MWVPLVSSLGPLTADYPGYSGRELKVSEFRVFRVELIPIAKQKVCGFFGQAMEDQS